MFKNLNERRMSSLPVLSITTDPQVVINVTESSNHNLSSTERENTSGFSLVINKIKGKFNNQSGSNRSSFSPSYAKSSNDIIKHSQSSSDVAGFSVLQTSNQELHQTPTGFRSTTSNRNISSISQFILSNQNNELPELKLSKVNRSASFLMSNKQSLFCDVYDVDQIHPQKIDNNLGSGNSLENGIQAAVENLTGLVAHSQYSGRDLLSRETMGDSSPKQFEELPTQLKDEERDIAEHSSINQNNGVEVNAVVTSIEKEENNESTFEKVAKKQPGRRKSSVDTTNVKEFGEKEEGYSHRRRAISDFSSKETSSKKYFSITTPPISKMLHSSHSSHSQNQENSPVSSININSRLNSRIESLGKSKSISSEKITSPTALLPKTPTPMNPRVKRDSSSEKRVSIKERRVSISQKRHSSMHTESISNMLENRIKNSISEDDAKKYIDEMENKIKKSENGESDRNQKSIDEGSKVIHESGNEYQFSRMSTSSKNNLKTVNNEDEKLFHSVFLKFSTENEALYNKYIFNLLIKNTYKRNFYIFATFWFLYCGFEFYQLRYGFPKGSTLIFELTNYITEVLILLFSLILIVTSYFETFYERFYQILNTLSIILITFQGISAALRTQSLDSHQTEYVSWFGFSYLFLIYMSFPSSFIQLSFFGSFLMVFYVVFLFSLGNYRETASLSSIVGSSLLLLAANFLGIYYRFTAELQLREGFLKYENQCICAGRLKNTQIQSEYLLSMILPRKTIEILGRRKSKSNRTHSSLQDTFVELHGVTVLFADIIGFTEFSSTVSTSQLISILSEIFAEFDTMATELDLEKIKTIGDCYEVAGGLPDQANEEQIKIYAEKVCFMAFFMIKAVAMISRKLGYNLHLRVGIHTGTVTAGVIGIWKFKYDIWSNDVETANLMEQTGKNSVPHISASTYELLKTSTTLKFLLSEKVEAFGKQIQTYDVSTSQKTNYATLAELRRAFLQQLVKEEVDPSIIEIPQNDEESENFEINKKMKKFSNEINKLTNCFKDIKKETSYKKDFFFIGKKVINGLIILLVYVLIIIVQYLFNEKVSLISIFLFIGVSLILSLHHFYIKRKYSNTVSFELQTSSKSKSVESLGKDLEQNIDTKNIQHNQATNFNGHYTLILIFISTIGIFVNSYTKNIVPSKNLLPLLDIFALHSIFFGYQMLYFNINLITFFIFFLIEYYYWHIVKLLDNNSQSVTEITFRKFQNIITIQSQILLGFVILLILTNNYRNDRICRLSYFLKIENDFAAKKIRKAQIATNNLLLNILPQNVVDLLKQNPTLQIAMDLNEVGILFCSICNFENVVQKNAIWLLNDIICDMDEICLEFGVEKIKTIGTKYLVMSEPNSNFASDHITRLVSFALDLQDYIKEFNSKTNQNFELKIGIHAGCVAAGVIGTKSFSYDVWGDTVNVASRMESTGRNDHIHITEKIYHHLKTLSGLRFEDRGMIYVKGKGELQTYFLFPKQPDE